MAQNAVDFRQPHGVAATSDAANLGLVEAGRTGHRYTWFQKAVCQNEKEWFVAN